MISNANSVNTNLDTLVGSFGPQQRHPEASFRVYGLTIIGLWKFIRRPIPNKPSNLCSPRLLVLSSLSAFETRQVSQNFNSFFSEPVKA